MTYAEAIQFLYTLRLFGARLGLENTFKLAALAGSPHEQLCFLHVAGTNGKGSTCAMLESIYRAAGLRVGLFTSPHLVSFRERIQVNRQRIAETDVARLVQETRPHLNQFHPDQHPTFFEVVTIIALRYFTEQRCDLVIWETGLGGRLDATNIVTPLASVITNIQLDHEKWLGKTVEKIAFEKAGIIKPGVPVVTAAEDESALAVIRDTAQQRNAPITIVTPRDFAHSPLNSVHLPLLGEHQKLNAALAVATIRAVASHIPVSDETAQRGLESVHWPGRLQLVKTPDGRTLLLDGAHNPAGIETLRTALREHFPNSKPALLFGTMRDKNWAAMCALLAPLAEKVFLSPVQSERGASLIELEQTFHQANSTLPITACSSLHEALARAAQEPFLVITGSLHFVGEVMEALHLSPSPTSDERGLNEWNAAGK